MGTMDVDDTARKLNFILLKNGLADGDPTFRTITVPSSCNLSELRKVIRDKCSILLKDVDPASLEVYKTDLDDVESDVLLQQLETQKVTIDPDKTVIRLIVDCTNAGELQATLRSR
ncbi:hypothetical protein BZG36_05742, partial [Bifiguratus adelaidae]